MHSIQAELKRSALASFTESWGAIYGTLERSSHTFIIFFRWVFYAPQAHPSTFKNMCGFLWEVRHGGVNSSRYAPFFSTSCYYVLN